MASSERRASNSVEGNAERAPSSPGSVVSEKRIYINVDNNFIKTLQIISDNKLSCTLFYFIYTLTVCIQWQLTIIEDLL